MALWVSHSSHHLQVAPVSVKAKTAQMISFQLLIGDHKLRFNPKEQHKDELSLRFLALPRLHLQGKVIAHKKKLPQVSLDLFVKQLNIDVTTDVLNQLLIVQNTFIKVSNKVSIEFTVVNTMYSL